MSLPSNIRAHRVSRGEKSLLMFSCLLHQFLMVKVLKE
jgi:hypothetical protein